MADEVVTEPVNDDDLGDAGGLDEIEGTLKLTSKDNQEFDVQKKYAYISVLVKTSCENDTSATEVPLPGVEGSILKFVAEYMNHHKGVEPPIVESPLKSTVMKEVVKDEWDATFIDDIGEGRQNLYDLILAANYMDIKSLLHLGLAKVASLIKGKPLDQLKSILSVDQPGQKGDKKKEEKTDN